MADIGEAEMQTLRNINLNLMPILLALLHHRSVTRAAEALNMSQSAVSEALGNLRHVFKDELLVRSGRQMLLTDLARALTPQVEEAVASFQKLLDTPDFDPGTLTRQFVIATADSVMMTIGPALTARLMQDAPQASLQFIGLSGPAIEHVRSGDVDLVVGPVEIISKTVDAHSAPLYDDEFACIMRRNHPLSRGKLTESDYWQAPHASYRPDYALATTLEELVQRQHGKEAVDVVRVPDFTLLPYFVETTDCLAMVSRQVAERLRQGTKIVVRELPFEMEPVPLGMFWTNIKHNDPTHRWFRELLAEIGRQLDA